MANGGDAEQVLQQLAQGLANKLMHQPTTKLKQASAAGRNEVIAISQELFELDSALDDGSKEKN